MTARSAGRTWPSDPAAACVLLASLYPCWEISYVPEGASGVERWPGKPYWASRPHDENRSTAITASQPEDLARGIGLAEEMLWPSQPSSAPR